MIAFFNLPCESTAKTPADRVKTLLGKLDSVRRSKELGYGVATQARLTSHKFMGSVGKILKNLPKPLERRSFYNNDLSILVDFCEEVQECLGRKKRPGAF